MGLNIHNLSDGTLLNVATDGLAEITIQAGNPNANGQSSRGLFIQWDHAEPTQLIIAGIEGAITLPGNVTSAVTGDLAAVVTEFDAWQGDYWSISGSTIVPGSYLHITPGCFVNLNVPTPGVYYVTVAITGRTGAEACGLIVRVLPQFNLPLSPALGWVPGDFIDLQVDVAARNVSSAVLGHSQGVKQGDDFTLAVVPKINGTLVTSGITAMSLTIIDQVNSPYAGAPLVFNAGSLTLTEVGSNPAQQYYTLVGNLRADIIRAWFNNLQTRITAQAAAPSQTTPLPPRNRLEALASLSITNGDGIITTSDFPFPILASP